MIAWSYLPWLWNAPGRVTAGTPASVMADPWRSLLSLPVMWDGNQLGGVRDLTGGHPAAQSVWWWIVGAPGLPDWIVQRLLVGSLVAIGGFGVLYLLRVHGWVGSGWLVAAAAYQWSPVVMVHAGTDVTGLFAWAALPWSVAFAGQAVQETGWRSAGRFGLAVGFASLSGPSAVLTLLVAPAGWILYELVTSSRLELRRYWAGVARLGAVTVGVNVWWLSVVRADLATGMAGTVLPSLSARSRTSSVVEVARGLGPWQQYATLRGRPVLDTVDAYLTNPALVVAGYLVVAATLASIALVKFRNRLYFVALFVVGTILGVGVGVDPDTHLSGRLLSALANRDIGPLLPTTAAGLALVSLAGAVCLAAGVRALIEGVSSLGTLPTVVATLALLATVPAWPLGRALDGAATRHDVVADTFRMAIDDGLDLGSTTRMLTVLPGLTDADRPWVALLDPLARPGGRPGVLLGGDVPRAPQAAVTLADLHDRVLTTPGTVARSDVSVDTVVSLARRLGVRDIVLAMPASEARGTQPGTQPKSLAARFAERGDLGIEVRCYPTRDCADAATTLAVVNVGPVMPRLRAVPASAAIVLDGDASGYLAAVEAGLVDGTQPVVMAASLDDDTLTSVLAEVGTVVVTDTNRDRTMDWSRLSDVAGPTRAEAQPAPDRGRNPAPFAGFRPARAGSRTVVRNSSLLWIDATGSGTPDGGADAFRPAYAVDGDVRTVWSMGGFEDGRPTALRMRFPAEVTIDELGLVQPADGRLITEVRLDFGDGSPRQTVRFTGSENDRTVAVDRTAPVRELTIEVTGSRDRGGDDRIAIAELRVGQVAANAEDVALPARVVTSMAAQDDPEATPEQSLVILLEREAPGEFGNGEHAVPLRRVITVPAGGRTFSASAVLLANLQVLPGRCTDPVVQIGDASYGVVRTGFRGGFMTVALCDPDDATGQPARIRLAEGPNLVRELASEEYRIDRLVLRSDGRPVSPAPAPELREITDERASSFGARVFGADEPFWLVASAAYTPDWSLTEELPKKPSLQQEGTWSDAVAVDGFAVGWRIEPGPRASDEHSLGFTIRWGRQRGIAAAAVLSAAVMVAAAIAALWRRRSPQPASSVGDDEPRSVHMAVVVLGAVALFGVGAGPAPGLIAGTTALLLEQRPTWYRIMGWFGAATVALTGAGIALYIAVRERVSSPVLLIDTVDPAGQLIWCGIALACTVAVSRTERRRNPSDLNLSWDRWWRRHHHDDDV
jgi:arabinofuranan 3-O-arabinosyltransferase